MDNNNSVFPQEERRNEYKRLDILQQDIKELTSASQKLLLTAEHHQKALDKWEMWREKHENEFGRFRENLLEVKTQLNWWADKLSGVEKSIHELTVQVSKIHETGLKLKGGWILLTVIASAVVGVVSLLKSFGVI